MKASSALAASLTTVLVLAACGKVTETATEKMAEKMIESQMSKDGTKAKVDLSSGTAKLTTTDASGKSSTMEFGGAQVSESDLGVPFYPGTKPAEGGASKVVTPQGTAYTVTLKTGDGPDKVAAFYRENLKSKAQGRDFMEMGGSDGQATLMLADNKTNSSVQVHVSKTDSGSDIAIMASRNTDK